MLALKEIERRLGVADRLAACLYDPRAPVQVRHSLADIIRFRLLMITAGYEDANVPTALRHDPAFKLALDRLPDAAGLRPQPTISRLENLPDLRALVRMGRALVGLSCASLRQVPHRIVLDLDDKCSFIEDFQLIFIPPKTSLRVLTVVFPRHILSIELYMTQLSSDCKSYRPPTSNITYKYYLLSPHHLCATAASSIQMPESSNLYHALVGRYLRVPLATVPSLNQCKIYNLGRELNMSSPNPLVIGSNER